MWFIVALTLSIFASSNSQQCEECRTLTVGNGTVSTFCDSGVQKATYECDVGYYPTVRDIYTCQNGQWSPFKDPTCSELCDNVDRVPCSKARQIIACDGDSNGRELEDGNITQFNHKHQFFGKTLYRLKVNFNGTVDLNNDSVSMKVGVIPDNINIYRVIYDQGHENGNDVPYNKTQRHNINCILNSELEAPFNVTDFIVLSWMNGLDNMTGVVVLQLAIASDSASNKTYAIFLYPENSTKPFMENKNDRFKRENRISTENKNFFIQRIDNFDSDSGCDLDEVENVKIIITATGIFSEYQCNCTNETDYKECINKRWTSTNCSSIKLTEGSSGLVEVCHNNEWGYVCDDYWGKTDAKIVCKELGFNYGAEPIRRRDKPDSRRYLLDDVHCKGSESNLFQCGRGRRNMNDIGEHNCEDDETAGVTCYTEENIGICINKTQDMSSPAGPIRVEYRNKSRYVCTNFWTNEDAQVACKWLGFNDSKYHQATYEGVKSGKETYWLDYVNCLGHEESLFACRYLKSKNGRCRSNHKGVAAVKCHGKPPEYNYWCD